MVALNRFKTTISRKFGAPAFYPSPDDDNGYAVADFPAVDPELGTRRDGGELVRQLHGRGMRIMTDLVLNHIRRAPLVVAARASRTSLRRDYYYWRPGNDAGRPPNNWRSVFGGSAWEQEAQKGEFYLHLYSRRPI